MAGTSRSGDRALLSIDVGMSAVRCNKSMGTSFKFSYVRFVLKAILDEPADVLGDDELQESTRGGDAHGLLARARLVLALRTLPLGDLDGDVHDALALPHLDVHGLADDRVGRGVVPQVKRR